MKTTASRLFWTSFVISGALLGSRTVQAQGACTTGVVCPGGACTGVVPFSNSAQGRPPNQNGIPPIPPIPPGTVTLPLQQFNPALHGGATLMKVEYFATIQALDAEAHAHNTDSTQICNLPNGYNFQFSYFFDDPAGHDLLGNIVDNLSNSTPIVLQPNGQAGDTFQSGPLLPPGGGPVHTSPTFCVDATSPGNQLAAFIGAGTIPFVPVAQATELFPGACGNVDVGFTSHFRWTVSVTYTFCLPQPAASNDSVRVCAGSPVVFNVLANDAGATPGSVDCATLHVVPGSGPNFGTVTVVNCLAGDNQPCTGACFRYVPNPGVPAGNTPVVDTFRYTYNTVAPNACLSNEATVTVVLHPNPVGVNDSFTACQGTTLNFDVLANDTFADALVIGGQTIVPAATPNCASLTVPNRPGNGTLTQHTACTGGGTHRCANQCMTFVPNPNFTGTVTFGYTFLDSFGCPGSGSVSLTFTARPSVTGGDLIICQGSTADFDVSAHSTPGGGTLVCSSIAIATQPLHGTAVVCNGANCPNCHIVYTPQPNFVGTDSFTYTVSNSLGCTSAASGPVNITVKQRPIAVDDTALIVGSPPNLPPITVNLYANDIPNPLPSTVVGTLLLAQCPPVHGTIVNFNPLTGVLVYQPDQNFSGTETLCYQLCETSTQGTCCSQAQLHITLNNPCIMINRRTPGSLLIFPQFDNRVDRITLVTITNTNCDMTVDSHGLFTNRIDVHYIYVGKYGPGHVPLPCLESDRTIHLSPCDTFTMYTSFDNPQMEEGYIYAYAVSPTTGEAISYNFLIGQEIVFASFENDEDAVNAIVFHAIPPTFQPTDIDHDNIRDLDGVEYDQAPDQIFIPRFLGQDPPGDGAIYRSQLFLIALSGGTLFDTQLAFLVYNDNEVQSSVSYTFRCWDDPFLTDISNGFLNTALKLEGDDPNEILGAPTREAGWMKINGTIAFSTNTVINDPAFYAVLLERTALKRVIDLPWELCTQDNGKLLPHSLNGEF